MMRFLLLIFVMIVSATLLQAVEYHYPKTDANSVSIDDQIIIRPGPALDVKSVHELSIFLKDEAGKIIAGRTILTPDGRTLLFKPATQLNYNTIYNVEMPDGIVSTLGERISGLKFSFRTVGKISDMELQKLSQEMQKAGIDPAFDDVIQEELPPDFPPITVNIKNNPSPGAILMSNTGTGFGNYIMILDSAGGVMKYKKMASTVSNFSLQTNGLIAYNRSIKPIFKAYSEARMYITDTELNVLDSVTRVDGLAPAPHVCYLLPNGHILYSSYEAYSVDMSKVIEGGHPNATVAGAILVELDAEKNMVFKWRTWDHYQVLDSYQPINDYLNIVTLFSNFNSVDLDFEGNYIVSNRLLSEVIKINSKTGDLMWRLGGKYNDFTFIDDRPEYAPFYFSMQHDARLLSNGNISIFDNGDQHTPPQSRAVEYQIDEVNMTAKLVWEHRSDPLIFARATGSMQRLKGGNSIIGWGTVGTEPKTDVLELSPDGTKQLELMLPKGITSFKALKFPYPFGQHKSRVMLDELKELNTYTFNKGEQVTGVKISFPMLESYLYNSLTVTKWDFAPKYPRFSADAPHVLPYKYYLEPNNIEKFNANIAFRIEGLDWLKFPDRTLVYRRDTLDKGVFERIPTLYSEFEKSLIIQADKFGEFIFVIENDNIAPAVPMLILPKDGQKLVHGTKPNLKWNPIGKFTSADVQLSGNSDFTELIIDEAYLKPTSMSVKSDLQNGTYYWRARQRDFENNPGEWSEPYSFEIGNAFLSLLNPAEAETLFVSNKNKSYIVYWDDNYDDTVKVELLKNGELFKMLEDTLVSFTNSFLWVTNDSLPEGDDFSVRITAFNRADAGTASSPIFSIRHGEVSVSEDSPIAAFITYPNPASNFVNLEFETVRESNSLIKIFSSDGQLVLAKGLGQLPAGVYSTSIDLKGLSSGSYIVSISDGNAVKSVGIIINK